MNDKEKSNSTWTWACKTDNALFINENRTFKTKNTRYKLSMKREMRAIPYSL